MNLFDQITGHRQIKNFFSNALQKERLFSSYLFTGPEGIGKKKTAVAIAAMLNCESTENAPCGTCRSCLKIQEGAHVDVNIIAAEKDEILAEQADNILDAIRFAPFEGKARVFVIDNAHQLNPTSGNMLLKTLEEPPSGNYFFLITSKPDSLLSTIRSRCQEVSFSSAGILEALKEDPDFDDSYYPWLKSGGGFVEDRDALSAFTGIRRLALQFLQEMVHPGQKSGLEIEDKVDETVGNGGKEDARIFFFQMEIILRDILAVISGKENAVINRDMTPELKRLAQKITPEAVFQLNRLVRKGASGLSYGIKIQHLAPVLLAEGVKAMR
ncbi:MAG: DNA polymerase III subunit delta' [Acidobacteria bacterium]|nr:DNA polymerase III subunit delta' [Acidobacteriota bacterium]